MGKKAKKIAKKRVSRKKTDKIEILDVKLTIWHKIIPPAIIAFLTAIFYYPSLKYPFQFDDLANITKKFDIRFANPLSGWWFRSRWMGEWLNRLNFEWGRFDPFYYRLTNLVIHILAGIFVFFLIFEGCSYLKKHPFFVKYALPIASATSALFMLHPVQTQAVSYVIQARLEGLATLFIVATLFLFLKAFQTKNIILKSSLIVATLFVGFLSCGTKEIAIVSPFLALAVDWFFLSGEEWSNFKSRLWFHGIFSLLIFVMFINHLPSNFFVNAAKLNLTSGNNRGNVLTAHAHDIIKPLHYLISSFKVVLHYLVIFLWPVTMSVEYDWKLSDSFLQLNSFFPFLILAAVASLAIYALIKKKYSFFGFGIIWFFVSVAPRSSIIPSPELICDYKTYLASVGWLFVIATCFVSASVFIIKKTKSAPPFMLKQVPQIALVILFAIPVGLGTVSRNIVWSSSVEFWRDISIKAPFKARAHNNLGVALSEEKKFDEAIPCYIKAISLDKHYSDPWSNLAVAYSVKGEIDKAIASLKQAIRIFPSYPEAYNNLGTLMIKKKNYEAAEKILLTAIKIRPYYGKAFFNLGRLYMDQGDNEKAWAQFKKATEGDLDTVEGFFTLGQMSIKLKKFDEAVKAFEKSLKLGQRIPDSQKQQIMFNLANSHFMLKNHEKALPIFEFLCKSNPTDHRYLYNLGETLFTKGDFDRALKVFAKLSNPPFGLAQANFRYASCLEKTGDFGKAREALQRILSAKELPPNFKEIAQKEIGRLNIQEKINAGNCTLTMNDLKQAFNNTNTG